jgi:F0F1-type ATP synthase assembly protein I
MRYAGLGIELAAAVGLLSLLGWWIDGRMGTAPWGLVVGALVGLIGGMALLVRSALTSVAPAREGGTGGDGTGRGEP